MYKKVVVRPWAPPELPGKRARLTAQTKKRHADLAHGTLEALDRMAKMQCRDPPSGTGLPIRAVDRIRKRLQESGSQGAGKVQRLQ